MLNFTQISKFQGQKGRGLGHVTHFYILTPLYSSGVDKARNFKFGMRIDLEAYKPRNSRVGQKGHGVRHVSDLLLSFWDPLYISGKDKVRKFKFGVQIDHRAYKSKNAKVGQRRVVYVTSSTFLKFWVPLYVSGTKKVRTFKLIVRPTNQKCKSRSKGAWPASHDLLL